MTISRRCSYNSRVVEEKLLRAKDGKAKADSPHKIFQGKHNRNLLQATENRLDE
jgi:hypothetical protein